VKINHATKKLFQGTTVLGMDINSIFVNISRYFYTLKYLRFKQIFYRIFYLAKNKYKTEHLKLMPRKCENILFINSIDILYVSYSDKNAFFLLNQIHQFHDRIDWNYMGSGLSWAYSLNCFEYLHHQTMNKEMGLRLIHDYIDQYRRIRIGYISYTISLRNFFWIRFLVKNEIRDEKINAFLYDTYMILSRNLEYHLLGNHLLENAFSLFLGAYYFRDFVFYRKAYKLLKLELKEQILKDGGHFEKSPVYHQTILYRLLDCINISLKNKWIEDDLLVFFWTTASAMLSWLKNITFPSGSIPFFSDSYQNSAPSTADLLCYAERLGITYKGSLLSDSKYRVFKGDSYTLICDIDGISPSYQCGHAHADTFNFVLEVNTAPFFVDTGCSTYQAGETRIFERGTFAHNTVVVNGTNSSDVWSSHRVGKRARVQILIDTPDKIVAQHNGYKGILHIRTFQKKTMSIEIIDEIKGETHHIKHNTQHTALFHLDYCIAPEDIVVQNNELVVSGIINCKFEGSSNLYLVNYEQAIGINKRANAKCVCVDFDEKLKTIICF